MFQFDLPKHAVIHVQMPSGGLQSLIHMGEGRFVTDLPPLMFHGAVPDGESVPLRGIDVSWNPKPHGTRGVSPVVFVFDAPGAMDAVKAYAEAGDPAAQEMLAKIEGGQKMLEARQAIGLVPASPVAQ